MVQHHKVASADRDPVAIVRAAYDRLGGRYWSWAERVDPPLRGEYATAATYGLDSDAVAVELGCGPGEPVGRQLAGRLHYVGVDISPVMLRLARQNAPGASLVLGDMATVGFRPRSIDAVVSFYSLIHLPRDRHAAVLNGISRWLRPGGRFAASLGATDNPDATEVDWLGGGEMYWSFFDADTNLRMITDAGLTVERAVEVDQMEDEAAVRFLWVIAKRPH